MALRDVIRQVRRELSELLFEQQQLLLVQGPNLEARFQSLLGKYQSELEQIRLDLRRARRSLELRRASLVRGEAVDLAALERQLDQELWQYRRRLQDQKDRQEASEQRLRKLRSAETSAAMRSLYRQLVKRLHPDLHPVQTPQQQQLWFDVQKSYQWGDWERLETLLAVTEDEFEESPEELARLQARLKQLSLDLQQLRQSFPFSLAQQLEDSAWVEQQVAQLKLEIVLARQRLAKVDSVLKEFQL
ncbi:MAG: hypothetical protein KF760_32905 [Candidatus Eremiobacteraeota bacterium]|nr:hypothetical protein [Candidatus Eremiobacteraeota bacterium]MCW5868525.1 hypothetical protein [Candidatus Eremiobacteraeota bacterium]